MTWFEYGGDTVIDTYSHVRLTPDLPSRSGNIWSKKKLPKANWQIEIEFKIHGSSSHISGDGFAFWVTTEKNKQGPIFGNQDYFKGLGVFFDTYSNTQHDETFPYVSAMIGDGQTPFDINNDGFQTKSGGCSAELKFRSVPTKAQITYVKDSFLEVKLQTNTEGVFEHCFTIDKVNLPEDVYMGFTALTGQLHDNHDIINVVTRTSLSKPNYVPGNSGNNKAIPHTSSSSSLGIFFKLLLVGALVAVIYFGYKANQSKNMKRF
ncbi:hypothetical protein K502DRAFT_302957 [Neoconidiobolus thromboides FSU 785]|nr:hypothetical protein K502DRAFT_302957 [Neoconidiobolus thromboides FSU 785]